MSKKPPRYGLLRGTTYKKARDFLDMDYLNKPGMGDAELSFLDSFCREYYQATFRKDGNNVHPDDQRRDCYQKNNERQRDLWNQRIRTPEPEYKEHSDDEDN